MLIISYSSIIRHNMSGRIVIFSKEVKQIKIKCEKKQSKGKRKVRGKGGSKEREETKKERE